MCHSCFKGKQAFKLQSFFQNICEKCIKIRTNNEAEKQCKCMYLYEDKKTCVIFSLHAILILAFIWGILLWFHHTAATNINIWNNWTRCISLNASLMANDFTCVVQTSWGETHTMHFGLCCSMTKKTAHIHMLKCANTHNLWWVWRFMISAWLYATLLYDCIMSECISWVKNISVSYFSQNQKKNTIFCIMKIKQKQK